MSWLTDALKALLAPILGWVAGWFSAKQDSKIQTIEQELKDRREADAKLEEISRLDDAARRERLRRL